MTLRVLTPEDLTEWRSIRLEGLKLAPESFLTTFDEERARPDSEVIERLAQGHILGLFEKDDLAGALSVDPETGAALAHRAWLNAFYVRAKWRGTHVAHVLMQSAIAKARALGCVQLELYVAVDNAHAIRFYERAGFVKCGQLPRAVRLPDRYQDDLHCVLDIDA
ncbi:MAG: GNAT family N-acetyltransferase [Paracoccaceae bacterium]